MIIINVVKGSFYTFSKIVKRLKVGSLYPMDNPWLKSASVSMCRTIGGHVSAYVSICQHMSACLQKNTGQSPDFIYFMTHQNGSTRSNMTITWLPTVLAITQKSSPWAPWLACSQVIATPCHPNFSCNPKNSWVLRKKGEFFGENMILPPVLEQNDAGPVADQHWSRLSGDCGCQEWGPRLTLLWEQRRITRNYDTENAIIQIVKKGNVGGFNPSQSKLSIGIIIPDGNKKRQCELLCVILCG